mmetsp:Transcript_23109/g.54529  ORF Transcript_23109/g.54529 Transcript_23109/m.54529 type:complete len:211 (+) Transcript_23109:2644-3276(+)
MPQSLSFVASSQTNTTDPNDGSASAWAAEDADSTTSAQVCCRSALRSLRRYVFFPHSTTLTPLRIGAESAGTSPPALRSSAAYFATPNRSSSPPPAPPLCFLGSVRTHMVPVGATTDPATWHASTHSGVRTGTPARVDCMTLSVLDLGAQSAGPLAPLPLTAAGEEAVTQSLVFPRWKSLVALSTMFLPFNFLQSELSLPVSASDKLDVT